jgi:hypothetical protein
MLHRSLRLTAAYVALGMAETSQLVGAAHDALDDGVYSYSLGELATFRDPTWADCYPLFVAALREFQEVVPAPAAAIMALLEHHAVRLAEGAATPAEALHDVYSIEFALRYDPPVKVPPDSLAPLRPFIDLYYALRVYHGYRESAEAQGLPQPDGPGPDELYADGVSLARRWCRDRWGPTMNPAWLTSAVVSLAAGIYTDRAFDRLPILADALEDAGCDRAEVLDHCRGTGPHARGCWVVDLLLGKG